MIRLAVLFAVIALPAAAHHVVSTIYDTEKPVQITGTVVRVDWLNPHIWIYVAVRDLQGKTVEWGCEGEAANALYKQGWRKDSVRSGEQLVIEGFPARNGTLFLNATSIRAADGRVVFEDVHR